MLLAGSPYTRSFPGRAVRLHEEVVLTELPGDPRGVLLHLDTREYYTVNESGLFLLRSLRKGATVDDLAARLRSRFRMQEDVAQGEVRRFLDSLGREGLLAD